MYKRGNCWYSDFIYKGERYKKSLGPVCRSAAKDKETTFKADVAAGI